MDASNVLGPFLQDVIGRDEVLTPSSGRLRTIHARIAKEVEDAKQELHSTVQQQWPTLQRQYNTTIDLSDRLKAITSEVQTLEGDLDGDESALRPRLHTKFVEHAQLAQRYRNTDALVELLQSLRNLQQSNDAVQNLLAQGRLDEIVPALQACERLVNEEIEDWKKTCEPYKSMREQYIHARNIAQERLEDALSRCVAFDGRQVTFAMHVLASEDPKSPPIRLHSLLNSLAALSGLEKHLRQIAENIVRNLVKPVLVERAFTVSRQSVDEDTQVLDLQSCPTTSLEACTDSLRSILQVINTTIASSEGLPENRDFLLSHIVPEIQQLLIKHVLTSSMPQTAEKGALAAFQDTCRVVADFEAQYLLGLNIKFEATVQEWVHHAGEHWANAVIQRSFAALRADVITSDYWNKTEKVDWLDDPNNSEDIERWERWLSDSAPTTLHQPQPKASTSKLPPSLVQAKPADTSYSAAIEADEDVAWKFEDQEHDEVQESQASVDNVAISSAHTSSGKRVEDSPDLDADDAWGFDDEPSEIEASEQPLNEDDTNAPTMRVNGHRKNTLSQSSSRSQGSQKGMLNIKGQDSQYISSTGGIDEDEDDGGWSFDADADLEATGEGEQRLEEVELAKPSLASPHKHSGHSRHSSIEDAWGWSRNPDPDEDKPIGKPTKVVVSKKLGAKGRNGSPTPAVSLKTDVESATSPATDTVPPQTGFQNIEKTTPSGEPKIAQAIPALAIESASESLKKEHTSLHVSLSAKRVAGTSLELSKAALTVASSSHSSIDVASSSKHLFKAASDVFDLYRAIVPVAHSTLISTVPSIGMQLSNDCLYVSHEGTRITTSTVDNQLLSRDERVAARRPIEALRHFGYTVLENQIELQRVPLMETLDEADGFRNTDDPKTFAQCQRCVRQLVHTIISIAHAWKPVLIKRVYLESLGILVNAVLLRVLVEIENQEDISEESSHRLNDLCKMLHELESLFQDGEESTIALHVPVWFKFKFLSELLEASMADIMYLFNEGHLVDFSATELSKLVRALFADSQLRQRNLETIARGRP